MGVKLSDVGAFVDGFFGGNGKVYAGGAAAGVYQGSLVLQDKVKGAFQKLGNKLGPVFGTSLLGQVLSGAQAAPGSTAAPIEQKILGLPLEKLKLYGVIAGAAIVGLILWILARSSRR